MWLPRGSGELRWDDAAVPLEGKGALSLLDGSRGRGEAKEAVFP